MKCPKCGAEMNLHAEKFVHGISGASTAEETGGTDGTLQEFHGCPMCGAAASRAATESFG